MMMMIIIISSIMANGWDRKNGIKTSKQKYFFGFLFHLGFIIGNKMARMFHTLK